MSLRPSLAVCIMKQKHSHLPNTDAAADRKIPNYDGGDSIVKRQRRFGSVM